MKKISQEVKGILLMIVITAGLMLLDIEELIPNAIATFFVVLGSTLLGITMEQYMSKQKKADPPKPVKKAKSRGRRKK